MHHYVISSLCKYQSALPHTWMAQPPAHLDYVHYSFYAPYGPIIIYVVCDWPKFHAGFDYINDNLNLLYTFLSICEHFGGVNLYLYYYPLMTNNKLFLGGITTLQSLLFHSFRILGAHTPACSSSCLVWDSNHTAMWDPCGLSCLIHHSIWLVSKLVFLSTL